MDSPNVDRLKKKLNSILLIDDDDIVHFCNQRLIAQLQITDHVHSELSGAEALQYLAEKQSYAPDYQAPDLILLDVNMPGMNGFEFLENYQKLDRPSSDHTRLVMLSSSTLDVDRKRASSFTCITDYYSKPLSLNALTEIISKYFPEFMEQEEAD